MSDAGDNSTSVEVDLASGRFSIKAKEGNLDAIFDRLEGILERFWQPKEASKNQNPGATLEEPDVDAGATASSSNGEVKPTDGTPRRKRSASSRAPDFKTVDLGLTDEQRVDIRNFFQEKAPSGQAAEIAVLGFRIKELTGKDSFDENDVFTALRIVNRPIPKDIDRVMTNIKEKGWGDRREKKLIINYETEDYVKFHMDQKAKRKS